MGAMTATTLPAAEEGGKMCCLCGEFEGLKPVREPGHEADNWTVDNWKEFDNNNFRRWLHQQMTEMSALLGIPAPQLLLYEVDKEQADEILLSEPNPMTVYSTGYAFDEPTYVVILRLTEKGKYPYFRKRYFKPQQLRETLAHELLHLALRDKLVHNDDYSVFNNSEERDELFYRYVNDLLNGNLLFDCEMRRERNQEALK